MGFGFGFFEYIFPVMFLFVFGLVIAVFIVTFSRIIREKRHNAHSPRLTVAAKVVSKRTNVSHHHSAGGVNGNMGSSYSSTTYYVTFEVGSGDRMELKVPASDFGYLVEGDSGSVTFKGTEFVSFDRD